MKSFIAILFFVSFTILAARLSFAEGFLDLYAGPSFTDDANVKVHTDVATTGREIDFRSDLTYGVRGGYWFNKVPWLGVAGDLSSLHAEGKNARFDLVPLTPMAMFRLPLFRDENIPQGLLQPYLGLGPSVALYSYASADFGPPITEIHNWDVNVGFQVPAGLAVQLSKHVALFGEYRYAYYRVKINQDLTTYLLDSVSGNSQNVARRLTTSLSMHNVLFGISLRF